MVIKMDNVAIHVQEEVMQLIESSGHIIRYLPPYSPDYNPIELTFSVLKAWMKRNWPFYRRTCRSYSELLRTLTTTMSTLRRSTHSSTPRHRKIDLAMMKTRKELANHAEMAMMIPPIIYGVSHHKQLLSI